MGPGTWHTPLGHLGYPFPPNAHLAQVSIYSKFTSSSGFTSHSSGATFWFDPASICAGPICSGPNCPGSICPGAHLSGTHLSEIQSSRTHLSATHSSWSPFVQDLFVRDPFVLCPIVQEPFVLESYELEMSRTHKLCPQAALLQCFFVRKLRCNRNLLNNFSTAPLAHCSFLGYVKILSKYVRSYESI